MQLLIDVGTVVGLPQREQDMLRELLEIYQSHYTKNWEKEKYYEGNIPLSDVNLGIALPFNMKSLQIGCAWGSKPSMCWRRGLSLTDLSMRAATSQTSLPES